jgi:hypothetical protein
VVLDVTSLVHLASLKESAGAEDAANGLAERFAPVDDEEHRVVGLEATSNQVLQERRAHRRVFGGPFVES